MRSRAALLPALLLLVFAPRAALALSVGDVTVTLNGQSLVPDLECVENSFGAQLSCFGQDVTADDGSWTLPSIELHFGGDDQYVATVRAFFSLRNDLLVAQTFEFSQQRPFASQFPFPLHRFYASVGAILVDLEGDGATLGDVGSPIFTGSIDGVPVATELAPPQTVTAAPFGSVPFSSGSSSLTVQPLSSIGQEVRFALSPGDLVAFNHSQPGPPGHRVVNFEVVPEIVPEPATLALLAAGLVGIASSRRRAARG